MKISYSEDKSFATIENMNVEDLQIISCALWDYVHIYENDIETLKHIVTLHKEIRESLYINRPDDEVVYIF